MNRGPQAQLARNMVLSSFRWDEGHADVWRLFADRARLPLLVAGLAEPWSHHGVTHVAGVESRAFLLGGAVAVELGAGFHAIRKSDGLLPGRKLSKLAEPDYRNHVHRLRMQATVGKGDAVLLVDDWAERGSQALAAKELIEQSGARFVGVSLIVDQLPEAVRKQLEPVNSLVKAAELGDPDTGPMATPSNPPR